MVGLCRRATLFWGLPATLQHSVSTEGQGLHRAGPGRCMGQIGCVTEAGPLWDPGFAHTIAPGSTHRGCRNGCRALHWSRGHRCPGTATPPSGLVSPDVGSLRSHPGTHVPPAREWRSHTLVQQQLVSAPFSPGGTPDRQLLLQSPPWLGALESHKVINTEVMGTGVL